MADERLQAAVPDGEGLRYTADRRRSPGTVGVTDDRLLVVDGETTSVEFESIEEVSARHVDWFLAVLGVVIVAVGLLAGIDDPLVGVGLVAAGVISLAVTYRKRGQVTVSVRGRGKPLQFHVESTDEFLDRLEDRLDRYERRLAEGDRRS